MCFRANRMAAGGAQSQQLDPRTEIPWLRPVPHAKEGTVLILLSLRFRIHSPRRPSIASTLPLSPAAIVRGDARRQESM